VSIEMILALVPESEHLTYQEALALAEERDEQAAKGLLHDLCPILPLFRLPSSFLDQVGYL